MNAIYWLIPLTLILLAVAVKILLWTLNNEQYDDLETPALRILSDDDEQDTLDHL